MKTLSLLSGAGDSAEIFVSRSANRRLAIQFELNLFLNGAELHLGDCLDRALDGMKPSPQGRQMPQLTHELIPIEGEETSAAEGQLRGHDGVIERL
jgi:hypothetical protein